MAFSSQLSAMVTDPRHSGHASSSTRQRLTADLFRRIRRRAHLILPRFARFTIAVIDAGDFSDLEGDR
jgi:hypothetical protein